MATDNIKVVLSAVDRASGTFAKVGGAANTLGKATGGVKGKVMALGSAVNQHGALPLLGLGAALGYAVTKGMAAEQNTARLTNAMKNNGTYTKAAYDDLNSYAKQLSTVTVNSAGTTKQTMALFQAFGMNTTQTKDATKATMDLAAGLKIDLGGASKLVAKAFAGNYTALSRYGIKVDESLPPQERFALLLGQITEKFGGMAEAMGSTTAGKMEILKNKVNALAASLGTSLLPAVNFVTDSLTALFTKGYDPSQVEGAFARWTDAMNGVNVVIAGIQLAWNEFIRLILVSMKDLATLGVHTPANIGGAFSDMRDRCGSALTDLDIKMAITRSRIRDMNGSGQEMRDQVSAAFEDMATNTSASFATMYSKLQTAITVGNPGLRGEAEKGMTDMMSAMLSKMPFIEGNMDKLMSQLVGTVAGADFKTAPRDKIYEMATTIAAFSGTPIQQVEELLLGMQGKIAGADLTTPTYTAALGIPTGIIASTPTVLGATGNVTTAIQSFLAATGLSTQPIHVTPPTNQNDVWANINSFWAGKTVYYTVQGKPGEALGLQTGGYVGATGDYRLHEGEVVLPPAIVSQIKQGKSQFTPSAQSASTVSSGGGVTVNLSAGAFMGTPGEARRFASLIGEYLKQEARR